MHTNGECYVCQSPCATCFGPDSDDCLTCVDGTYLYSSNNTCLESCGVGYFGNSTTLKCVECYVSCLECSGPLTTDCLSCASGYS